MNKKETSKLLIAILLVGSFSVQASLADQFWSIVSKVKTKLGFVNQEKTIELPTIPQPNNNPLDLSVYNQEISKLYPANKMISSWSADKKKKTHLGYVKELFRIVQVRTPKRDEIGKWYNILEQGSSRESVYRAIVLGDTYRRLERGGEQTTLAAVNFSNDYLQKFLQQKTKTDLLKKLDAYRLKRIVVDTTLKTIELLEREPESLFKWYAVFSSELATQFPQIWKYRLRANTSDESHYRWANATPLQHIKSEIILKLHVVYNHLSDITLKSQ